MIETVGNKYEIPASTALKLGKIYYTSLKFFQLFIECGYEGDKSSFQTICYSYFLALGDVDKKRPQ